MLPLSSLSLLLLIPPSPSGMTAGGAKAGCGAMAMRWEMASEVAEDTRLTVDADSLLSSAVWTSYLVPACHGKRQLSYKCPLSRERLA